MLCCAVGVVGVCAPISSRVHGHAQHSAAANRGAADLLPAIAHQVNGAICKSNGCLLEGGPARDAGGVDGNAGCRRQTPGEVVAAPLAELVLDAVEETVARVVCGFLRSSKGRLNTVVHHLHRSVMPGWAVLECLVVAGGSYPAGANRSRYRFQPIILGDGGSCRTSCATPRSKPGKQETRRWRPVRECFGTNSSQAQISDCDHLEQFRSLLKLFILICHPGLPLKSSKRCTQ